MDTPEHHKKIKKKINLKKAAKEQLYASPHHSRQFDYEGQNFDKIFHAFLSRFSGFLSPASFMLAYSDWLADLAISPAKQQDLKNKAIKKLISFSIYANQYGLDKECDACVPVKKSDHRFQNVLWQQWPFNLYSQFFLLSEQWWDEATTHINGVSKHHERIVNFLTRQILDIFSPSNTPWMNPEVITTSFSQGGMNLVNGYTNMMDDIFRNINEKPPAGCENFKVGVDVAITSGKVIYRNHLIELIQYTPTTSSVYEEPILIVPAWIMKYYILDLSPNNSMVKYLVEKGHTVFMISWRNPTSQDGRIGLNDYAIQGILSAIDIINKILPKQKIHGVGYCIGGTLLMIAAALMGAESDDRLKTITLFAAQTDFREAGELLLFIDENQIAFLEDTMWEKGYLDGNHMAGAFSMLRSIDLIWSRIIRDYLLGTRRPINDLMAWDYDTTRLPYKMHSEYLRKLFLNNELVEGHYKIFNHVISLTDIKAPIFAVSTLKDHVAPWKSVYKIHHYTNTDITFVLTNAGHNTGIVNVPGEPGRSYLINTHKKREKYVGPITWRRAAERHKGSWWPAWEQWVANQSGQQVKPPDFGNPNKDINILCDAPGLYVLQK